MKKDFVTRALVGLLTIFCVLNLTFFILKVIPGGPFDRARVLPPAIQDNIEAQYGLDDSVFVQYKTYMSNLLKGDLGVSYRYQGQKVEDIIKRTFPVSALLGFCALVISLVLGGLLGLYSALKKDSWQDYLILGLMSLGLAVPNFVIATGLIYLFSYKLGLLPPALWGSPEQAVLPIITLSIYPAMLIARFLRTSLVEELSKEYILTARAKGLSQYRVVFRHALPNSIIPLITYFGPLVAGILMGSFVIEKIFAIPGLGSHLISSISNRDYPLSLGITLFYACLIVGINMLLDYIYRFIDPRISTSSKGIGA